MQQALSLVWISGEMYVLSMRRTKCFGLQLGGGFGLSQRQQPVVTAVKPQGLGLFCFDANVGPYPTHDAKQSQRESKQEEQN